MRCRELRNELLRDLATIEKFPNEVLINNETLQRMLEKMIALCDIVLDIERDLEKGEGVAAQDAD